MKRTLKRLGGGLLAAVTLVAGGGALALGATPAGASSKQVTAAGSFTTYQLMHALFPTSINNLLPAGTTAHQKVAATASYCTGGINFTSVSGGAPNGSGAGKTFLHTEESTATKTAKKQGCVTIGRSSSPPEPTTLSTGSGSGDPAGAHFDYYAYALDGVAPLVGKNAGGTSTAPVTITRAEMQGIYRCKAGFTNWHTLGGTTGAIVRFWPQSGSGTRAVYTNILGFTAEKTHTATASSTCTTPAITKFTTVTIGGTVTQGVPNEENTESGIVYANHLVTTTPTHPNKSHHTIKDAIFVYSAGKYVSEWNNTSEYGTGTKHNRISNATIGNFTPTNLEIAKMQTTSTHGGQAFVNFTTATTTTPKRTGKRAHINTTTVVEANEWYSHIPATKPSTASASTAAVPGVRYVFNVCDTALPGYNTCKTLVGFDNQKVTAATTVTNGGGTKSRLCAGDDSSVIAAQGFVPLSNSAGPVSQDNLVGANCRQFPGFHFPGQAPATTYKHWTFNTWVNPTT